MSALHPPLTTLTFASRGSVVTARGLIVELCAPTDPDAGRTTVGTEGFPVVALTTGRLEVSAFVVREGGSLEPRLLGKGAAVDVLATCAVRAASVQGRGEDTARFTALAAVVPVYTCPPGSTEPLVDVLATGMFAPAAEGARAAQQIADSVYGRLEWPRALSWTVEELGELAQAHRQGLGEYRMLEELGQVYWWVHCLANIAEVDVATAAAIALDREEARQRATYGALRPYRPSRTETA